MDFIFMAEAECPAAIVQEANRIDPTKIESISAWWGITSPDASPECLSALVGMAAKRIDKSSDINFQKGVMNVGERVAATNSVDVVQELTEMAHRLMPLTRNFTSFYNMLSANQIDLIEVLSSHPSPQWELTSYPTSHDAFLRGIYLLQMNAPRAQEDFAEGLAMLATDINVFGPHVRYLLEIRPPSFHQLLEPYVNDSRRPKGLFGPSYPIGEYIKAKLEHRLALPKSDHPRGKRQIPKDYFDR